MRENEIFALDIGTHSVVGIIGKIEEEIFHVFDYEQRFHKRGAMRDGQIEDIALVAKAVGEVKDALEERNGCELDRTAIAAAGRLLLTKKASFEQQLPETSITREMIRSLEYNALSVAIDSFSQETPKEGGIGHYSCVGYSVIGYWLDDYRYSNLEGHRGDRVRIEVIAAFLPFSVIRSLHSVTEQCGLSVDSLTLEPIAAINAIVPIDIRLLNIAIIDIGAGTSDIAISKNGSIVAYDMVTIAGDELTEAMMQYFLCDFETIERMKRSMQEEGEEISYVNILGIKESCRREEIIKATEETVEHLCEEVCKRIVEINEKAPVAVFLTGGASQFPGLCEKVAAALELPQERVSIGGKQSYKYIKVFDEALLSPEYVTPLGIGATYRLTNGNDFFSITVNGRKIMFPETGQVKVMDALLLAGIKASDLIGHTPAPLDFVVNGVRRTIRGVQAVSGELYVNETRATLDTQIHAGDKIAVIFAKDGSIPKISAGDLMKEFGEAVKIFVNGEEVSSDYQVVSGDVIDLSHGETAAPAGTEILTGTETESDRKVVESPISIQISLNDKWTEIVSSSQGAPQFLDLFNYVEIDAENPQGDLVVTLNGQTVSYTEVLKEGDHAEIRWSGEKKKE